jgi:DNA replication protein DnaC
MKQPEEFYQGRWARAGIPIKVRGLRFTDYEAYASPKDTHLSVKVALKAARRFVEEFPEHYISDSRAKAGRYPEDRSKIGKGLLFYGHNGTRKSTLAITTLTEIQYRSAGYETYYIKFSEWQRALMDSYGKEDTERIAIVRKILNDVRSRHVVVIDDMGQEYRTTSEHTERKWHELLRVRAENALPTIATTNVEPEAFRAVYGDSFASFAKEAFEMYPLFGKDIRQG